MLGSLLLIVMMATSFAAGYCTRSLVSHRRRTKYIKWEPYVRPSRSSQPPIPDAIGRPQRRVAEAICIWQ